MNAEQKMVGLRGCWSSLAAKATLLVGVASTTAAAGPIMQFRLVAETSMPAPGTEPAIVFNSLTTPISHDLMIPKLDEAGRVAFMAFLSGPGIDFSNAQGMWAERDGTLQLVARGGQPAPGTEEGVVFLGVPSLELPFAPEGGGAQIAFHAELIGNGIDFTNDEGFWSGGPGSLTLVAREGSPPPGLPELRFSNPFGTTNEVGHVLMRSDLLGPGVDNTNRTALFTNRSGALELLLREGDTAPFTEPGTVFGGNVPFRAHPINANSTIALSAKVEGPAVVSSNDQLLYVERNGALELLLREGDPAPNAGPGVTFGGGSSELLLNFVEMNNIGRVAFLLRLGGAVPTQTAIYSDRTGALAPVALPGQPAPGTNFDYTFFGPVRLNNADQVAFDVAFPHGGGIFTPPPFGVFSDVDGTILPVVSPGDMTLEGEVIENARCSGINSAGQMLLSLRVGSPTLRTGFWLRDATGRLHRIAAAGDQFDVDGNGSDVREVMRVVTGGLNEAGQVAIRLDFVDGSSAHVVASLPCRAMSMDISQFIAALLASDADPTTLCLHDFNGDDVLDGLDIQPLVQNLLEP